MKTPRIGTMLVLALGAAALAGGCVSQGDYDNVYEQNRVLSGSTATLQRERDQARADLESTRAQLARSEQAVAELKRLNGDLLKRLEDAGLSLSDFEKRLSGIDLVMLDPQTDRALRELADRYPNLISYDAQRGMLRFASDLTFASGDDTVRSDAKTSLAALADVLKSSSALPYEVIIVGHTDSQRISSGTARRHPTNMHLSCHRAISVRRELAGLGVDEEKMQAAGWGEFRPAVPNTGNGNTPANRRVEIYLTRLNETAKETPGMREKAEPKVQPATPRHEPEEVVK